MFQNIAKEKYDEARELRGLFEKQLKELYWAEGIMLPMLDETIYNASSPDLIAQLEVHRITTAGHIFRIEKIFELIGLTPEKLTYEGVQCLIDEAQNMPGLIKQGVVRDAAIIAILQKIKHYEIACYGTMRAYSLALREEDVVTLLEQTLMEEKEADLAFSHIAESHINIEAADKEI